jgi:hypothetical protein
MIRIIRTCRTGLQFPAATAGKLWPQQLRTDERPRPRSRSPVSDTDAQPERVGTYFRKINVEKWPTFKAGRVSSRVHVWGNYTSDRLILNEIRGFQL